MLNVADLKGALTLEQLEDLVDNDRVSLDDILGDLPLGCNIVRIDYTQDLLLENIHSTNLNDLEEELWDSGDFIDDYWNQMYELVYNRIDTFLTEPGKAEYHLHDIPGALIDYAVDYYPMEIEVVNYPEKEES